MASPLLNRSHVGFASTLWWKRDKPNISVFAFTGSHWTKRNGTKWVLLKLAVLSKKVKLQTAHARHHTLPLKRKNTAGKCEWFDKLPCFRRDETSADAGMNFASFLREWASKYCMVAFLRKERWLQVSATTKGKLGRSEGPLFRAQTAHRFIFETVYMSTCLPADNVGQRKPIPHVAVSLPACLPVSPQCRLPLLQSVMPLINSGSSISSSVLSPALSATLIPSSLPDGILALHTVCRSLWIIDGKAASDMSLSEAQ